MKDSMDHSLMNENLYSSLTHICINEISIRNHPYIISMFINNSEQPYIDIKVESKESADQWKSSFDTTAIEIMTSKTGNFKSFDVFVNMLEKAINQKNSSVSIDLFTSDDIKLIRKNEQDQKKSSTNKFSTKRYLILIYNAEYDRIYYPLSLRYCGKSNPINLIEQIRQLETENQILKSRFEFDIEHFNLKQEYLRLKKENDNYRQQLLLYNSKEKDQQIKFLFQTIRTSEDALIKEQNNLQKIKIKKDDRYKLLLNQIQSLKISERQLKLKVKNLTNQMNLFKNNCLPYNCRQRSASLSHPTSHDQRRYRSGSATKRFPSSADSRVRFNPTTYIHEKNLKLRQNEVQKKKEIRRRLNSGRHRSDSDIEDTTFKYKNNDLRISNSRKISSRKRTNNLNQHKSKDSIDSDIEGVSSPLILHKAASNNSTILFSPEYSHQNEQNPYLTLINSPNTDNIIDIDQRLKSLEKFLKQNFPH